MRKRINTLNTGVFYHGLSYSDTKGLCFEPEAFAADIERVMKKTGTDAFMYGTREAIPDETLYAMARLAAKNNYLFGIIYAYQFPPEGKRSLFTKENVAEIERIAGDLFLGEYFGETGTNRAAKDKGYFVEDPDVIALEMPPQNFEDMRQAKEHYVAFVKKMVDYNKSIGLYKSLNVEPTALQKYNFEAGIGIAAPELMPGNPETVSAFARGASIAYKRDKWFGYIANEWYGGYYHEDPIKAKRLELAYKWVYMSGANMANLESGTTGMSSFGYILEPNSPECAEYRRIQREFSKFLKKDTRPPCGPLTRVAFVHGNYDGFTEFLGGSSWCQFGRKEWGKDAPERSWNILEEVYRGKFWHDFSSHGDSDGCDLYTAPAYGMFDVIPAESPADVFKGYDFLIFAGWNTMTDEIYENLKEFVSAGGNLLICAAHLDPSAKRGEKKLFRDGKLSEFLGCDLTGISSVNNGVKFRRTSKIKDIYYPAPKNLASDANYPSGFADWADIELKGARVVGLFSDTFDTPSGDGEARPFLVENDYGKGIVSLLTNVDYPGHGGVYPIYRAVVKEMLAASHRSCDLKVVCGDKVRFSLFYDDVTGDEKLYLLNTDFTLPCAAVIKYRGEEKHIMLKPLALRAIEFKEKE